MQGCTDFRRVMNLEDRHLVTRDERLDEHVAPIHRRALDGAPPWSAERAGGWHGLMLGMSVYGHKKTKLAPRLQNRAASRPDMSRAARKVYSGASVGELPTPLRFIAVA